MASLSHDDVRHIAKLARLSLSDAEVEKFTTELSGILTYIDMLGKVDTTGVAEQSQVTGLSNSLRDDVVRPSSATREELLATSPLPIVDNQIQTSSAHG